MERLHIQAYGLISTLFENKVSHPIDEMNIMKPIVDIQGLVGAVNVKKNVATEFKTIVTNIVN